MNQLLKSQKFAVIPDLITPERAASYAQEFIQYVDKFNPRADPQAPNSPAKYDFLPFTKLLVELLPRMSSELGEPLLPTYTYARIYRNGEVLERHTDRPACEISVTLNLKKDVDWPIYFKRLDGSEVGLELSPGQGAMYYGYDMEHWREAYTGNEFVQVFMHYVRANGPYDWAVFDKMRK